MKKLLYIVIVVMVIVGTAFYGLNSIKKGLSTQTEGSSLIVQGPTTVDKTFDEKVYTKDVDIFVYNSPTPETLAHEEKIVKGTKLRILGRENGFYHVKYNAQVELKDGYIPTWYLDDEKAAIAACDYGYLVLKEARKGLLYPDGPEIVDLEQGKLLKPFLESGDWVEVNIIVYDIPAVLNAWVEKTDLVSSDKMQANEGFIPSDAELYFVDEFKDIKIAKPQKEAYPKSVNIMKREGSYAYVSAAGGWTAWVENKWITYTDKDLK